MATTTCKTCSWPWQAKVFFTETPPPQLAAVQLVHTFFAQQLNRPHADTQMLVHPLAVKVVRHAGQLDLAVQRLVTNMNSYKIIFGMIRAQSHEKKLQTTFQQVCDHPESGEAKVGDLVGVSVYKIKLNRQEYLIAYRLPTPQAQSHGVNVELLMIDFYQVGLHENFYDELKRYLKLEG